MNTDIRVDVGFLDHWKTDTLIVECGAEGVLALMRLWIFAAQNKPDGRLTGIQTHTIERVAKWRGEPGALLRVLTETRFIEQDQEGIWLLHDWVRHNPYAASAEWRHERAKKANAARRTKQEPQEDGYKPATSALVARSMPPPAPAPVPAPFPAPAPAPSPKEEGGNKDAGAAPSAADAASPPATAITPITLGAGLMWEGITQRQRELWRAAYPAIDLDTELAKAAAWIVANPTHRKSNWARYLNAWLKRSQDQARPGASAPPRADPQPPLTPEQAEWDAILHRLNRPVIEGDCLHECH